jgi:hypothetical protein
MFHISNKFEIACVDTAWDLQANIVEMPAARFWYKFTKAGGEKAFAEEGVLWTSCFGGRAAMKYNWLRSVPLVMSRCTATAACKRCEAS